MQKGRSKVLFIIPTLEGGGSEKVLHLLINHVSNEKFDKLLVTITRKGIYYNKLSDDIKKFFLGAKKVRLSGFRLYKAIKKLKPDIIFSFNVNHINLVLILFLVFYKKKFFLITRESNVLSVMVKKKGHWKHLMALTYRFFYKKVDSIICQSYYMKNDMITNFGISSEKCLIINNPINYQKIISHSFSKDLLFNKDSINILAVGRLTYQKGYDQLISCIPLISNSRVCFTILGGATFEHPQYINELRGLVRRLNVEDRISFIDFQNNPYPYMNQADVLVMTSRHEGFPNVALEAMALGKPVVAFDSPGGQNDLIIDDFNGFLVENGNINKFAKAIDRAIEKPWNNKAISSYIIENFDINRVAKKYEELFMKLLFLCE